MNIEQRLLVLRLDLEFDDCRAPDVLGVEHVYLVTGFDFNDSVLLLPAPVILDPLLEPLGFVFVAELAFAIYQDLDSIVNDLGLLEDPLSDVLSAVRALLLANQTLSDTLFTERMTTHRCPAADYVVHADRTCESVQLSERFFKT